MNNALSLALSSLGATLTKKTYSNMQLKAALSDSSLQKQERSLYKRLYFGALERLRTLDFFIERFSNMEMRKMSPALLNCLRLGIYQLLYCDGISDGAAIFETVELAKRAVGPAAGMINAILRKVSLNKDLLERLPSPDILYSVDSSIIDLLVKGYGQEAAFDYLAGLFAPAQIYARVNTLKTDAGALIVDLAAQGIAARPGLLENSLSLTCSRSIEGCSAYGRGLFFLQGLSSQAAVSVLNPAPGATLLDLCAAPGLKAFCAAMMMRDTGLIIAYDLHPHRVKLITAGAQRLGITSINAVCADTSLALPPDIRADFALCDVPCSGLGMMHKHPELRYKRAEDFSALPALQQKILQNAADRLSKNGRLLYCTCTLNPAENGGVVDAFLSQNPDFYLIGFDCPLAEGAISTRGGELTLMPAGGEGFYLALLGRRR